MGTGTRFRDSKKAWAAGCAVVLLCALAAVLRTLNEQQQVAQAAAKAQYEKRMAQSPAVSPSLSPPPPPPPPPPSPPAASPEGSGQCGEFKQNLEYDGDVVLWGTSNIQKDAAACCESCHSQRKRAEERGERGCSVWVFCGKEGGCATQKKGECWLKKASMPLPQVRGKGPGCDWTSGEAMSATEAAAMKAELARITEAERTRRERPGNPRVFLDVEINGKAHGRLEFVLYAHESPRHAENFRAMCTGEKGGKLSFKVRRRTGDLATNPSSRDAALGPSSRPLVSQTHARLGPWPHCRLLDARGAALSPARRLPPRPPGHEVLPHHRHVHRPGGRAGRLLHLGRQLRRRPGRPRPQARQAGAALRGQRRPQHQHGPLLRRRLAGAAPQRRVHGLRRGGRGIRDDVGDQQAHRQGHGQGHRQCDRVGGRLPQELRPAARGRAEVQDQGDDAVLGAGAVGDGVLGLMS
eukprot:Transcript_24499.p1 GENE.Transcript_24499~~Transcript_24499.p1  ORF type:complete len:466 (+),score=90.70 Transcript_24499:24-1421(+)